MREPFRTRLSEVEIGQAVDDIRQRIERRHGWPPLGEGERRAAIEEVGDLDAKAKRIVASIHEWFPRRPLPRFDSRALGYEYERLRSLVEDVPWDEVDGTEFMSWTDWLGVMDDAMFAYYLPTILVTYISQWPLALGSNSFRETMDRLDPTGQGSDLFALTGAQKQCVLGFLDFFARLDWLSWGETSEGYDLVSLAEVWRESLDVPAPRQA